MKTPFASTRLLAATAALVAAFAGMAAEPQERQRLAVADYAVYVDLPTAFAFVKLPDGWKFVGKLDADQLRHLPAATLTSLLAEEPQQGQGQEAPETHDAIHEAPVRRGRALRNSADRQGRRIQRIARPGRQGAGIAARRAFAHPAVIGHAKRHAPDARFDPCIGPTQKKKGCIAATLCILGGP